jgi:hypothetical protein
VRLDGGRLTAARAVRSCEIDYEEPVRAFEPLQLRVATLDELDARSGDELAHEIGHEHLASPGVTRDTRRVVHGGAEELVGL